MIRILCLHGARSNVVLLKRSMKTLILKGSKMNMEFDFLQAQFQSEEEQKAKSDLFQWWSFPTQGDMFIDTAYDTAAQSLKQLESQWKNGHYDVLFSFSQGSALAQLFMFNLFQNKELSIPKCVVLCSTFDISPIELRWNTELNGHCNVCPVISCTGERDDLIPPTKSIQAVENVFDKSILKQFQHAGGHYVPSRSESVMELLQYIYSLCYTECKETDDSMVLN
jgi:predicted esterase